MVVVEVGVWGGEIRGGPGRVDDGRESADEHQLNAEPIGATKGEDNGAECRDECCGRRHDFGSRGAGVQKRRLRAAKRSLGRSGTRRKQRGGVVLRGRCFIPPGYGVIIAV